MNQPTEDRISRLEQEQAQLKEEVRKLKEQQTEPIHVTVERRQTEVERTQELHTAFLQELDRKSDLHTGLINELRVDMQKRFDAIADVQMLILARLPEKDK
jgi:hypothetical protein